MLLKELAAKEMEILKEALPLLNRIGILWNPNTPSHPSAMLAAQSSGERLGLQVLAVPVRTETDFDAAFSKMTKERLGGFLALGAPIFQIQRVPLTDLALK